MTYRAGTLVPLESGREYPDKHGKRSGLIVTDPWHECRHSSATVPHGSDQISIGGALLPFRIAEIARPRDSPRQFGWRMPIRPVTFGAANLVQAPPPLYLRPPRLSEAPQVSNQSIRLCLQVALFRRIELDSQRRSTLNTFHQFVHIVRVQESFPKVARRARKPGCVRSIPPSLRTVTRRTVPSISRGGFGALVRRNRWCCGIPYQHHSDDPGEPPPHRPRVAQGLANSYRRTFLENPADPEEMSQASPAQLSALAAWTSSASRTAIWPNTTSAAGNAQRSKQVWGQC